MANPYTDAVFNTFFPDGYFQTARGQRRIKGCVLKQVAGAIAHRANADGSCFPGYARIGKDTQLSERTCIQAVKWLEHAGFLKREVRGSKSGHSNLYTIRQPFKQQDKQWQFADWDMATTMRPVQVNPVQMKPVQGEGEPGSPQPCTQFTLTMNPVQMNASLNTSFNAPCNAYRQGDGTEQSLVQIETKTQSRPILGTICHGLSVLEAKVCLRSAWTNRNGVECPWSIPAERALQKFLVSNPTLTFADWQKCVDNRMESSDRPSGESPEKFIPRILEYIDGPLDQYGKDPDGDKKRRDRQLDELFRERYGRPEGESLR